MLAYGEQVHREWLGSGLELVWLHAPHALQAALALDAAGHVYLEQRLATQMACNPHKGEGHDPRLRDMTQREFEIFVMFARGLPARQIAEKLCISSKTVSNHMTPARGWR